MVVALVALFTALSGTAVAAGVVPLAKRALVAENAKKVQGRTPAQLSAMPSPSRSAASLASVNSAPWSLGPDTGQDFAVRCDPGQKAVGGGFDRASGVPFAVDTRPSGDGQSWRIVLLNLSDTTPASGRVYAVCLR